MALSGREMAKIHSLEDGITEAGLAIRDIFTTGGPVFVAVYGDTKSGAVSFVKGVQQLFTPILSIWEPFQQHFFKNYVNCKPHFRDVAIFLPCSWERKLKNLQCDPDYLVRDYAHTTIDLRIGIYNPHFSSGIIGEYDMIIANTSLSTSDEIQRNSFVLSKAL